MFYVLEVPPHPILEILLGVTDIDLARCFALDPVHYYRNSADFSVLEIS
jgi:hypothetical protein